MNAPLFSARRPLPAARPGPAEARDAEGHFAACREASRRISQDLALLSSKVKFQRRVVRSGDVIYRTGEAFNALHIVNAGFFKLVSSTRDGREQVVALKFRGDWMGFDGIASGAFACDAVAIDTGEVWSAPYGVFLGACTDELGLLMHLHEAMSREIVRDRDSLMSVCTLPAVARVAEFLRYWADCLARRGLRTDQMALRMTRAEIGNYLGMTLESVSRSLSRLEKERLIAFDRNRREVTLPDAQALARFVQRIVAPGAAADAGRPRDETAPGCVDAQPSARPIAARSSSRV